MRRMRIGIFSNEEREYIKKVKDILKSGYLTEGKNTNLLEEEWVKATRENSKISERKEFRHDAVAVSSGMSGIFLVLWFLKYMSRYKYNTILIPAFTFCGVYDIPRLLGYDIRFVNTGDDLQMRAEQVRDILFELGKQKKASKTIVYNVASLGIINRTVFDIGEIADEFGSLYIIDASHSHFCRYKNIDISEYADISIFSMYPTKVVTMGEGGIIDVNLRCAEGKVENNIAEYLRYARCEGRDRAGVSVFSYSSGNYKPSEFQSALGLVEVKHYKEIVKHRRKIANIYREHGIELLQDVYSEGESTYYKYTMLCGSEERKAKLIKIMNEKDIRPAGYSYLLSMLRFEQVQAMTDKEKRIAESHINLPYSRFMTQVDIERVIEAIKEWREKL